jgi:hypothetical protein
LNIKILELATAMRECGYDCSEEDIFEDIINKLDEEIDEFN